MKKLFKGVILVALCVCAMASFSLAASAEERVTIYSQAGDCIKVYQSEVSVYAKWGWSTDIDDVRTILYSSRGSAYVYNAQVSQYLSLGWSLTPVKVDWATPLPMTFERKSAYSTNTLDITTFDVSDFEYLSGTDKIRIHYDFDYTESGTVNLYFNCYDSNGKKIQSIFFNKYSDYIDVSPSTATFTVTPYAGYGETVSGKFVYRRQINMYSSDGRSITVYDIQGPVYARVGWQYAVDMYSLDGRTIKVAPYEVKAYKAVGWYTYEGYLYAKLKEKVDECISSKKYNDAIEWVEASEEFFEGTEYASSARMLKTKTMDLWRSSIRCPLAYVDSEIGDYYGTPEVAVGFRNVSYKDISEIKIHFTCYNAFGGVVETGYEAYTASGNIGSGDAVTATWRFYGKGDIDYIKDVKIIEIVYADGTKW